MAIGGVGNGQGYRFGTNVTSSGSALSRLPKFREPRAFKQKLLTPRFTNLGAELVNLRGLYFAESSKNPNWYANFQGNNRVKALKAQYPQPPSLGKRIGLYEHRIKTYRNAIQSRITAIQKLRGMIQTVSWKKTLSQAAPRDNSPPAIVSYYKQVIAEHKASIKPLEQRVQSWQRRIDFLEANETAIRNTDPNKLAAVLRQRAESEQPR
jgi:hypothetical protein